MYTSHRWAFLVAMAMLTSTPAFANGRYPLANQVVIAPGDTSYLVLRSTFGIVQSFDDGKTWSWVCERSAGYSDRDDPSIGLTADGTVLVGSDGLTVSHDRGCSWSAAEAIAAPAGVIDLDVDREHPSRAVVLVGTGDGTGRFIDTLFESTDNGRTWAPLGTPIDDGLVAETVELTPPGRVYMSGRDASNQGVLQFSDDGAASWTRLPIDLEGAMVPFIAAVDPANGDRVYIRSIVAGGDRLFVTEDAGSSFHAIFSPAVGGMYGVALSPDGKKLAVGGPKIGVHVASTADHQFQQVSAVGPYCLRWTGAGLYACAKEADDHFTLGLSKDEGAHFEALLHLPAVVPLACAPSTPTGSICGAYWGSVAPLIGADAGDAAPGPPDGPVLNPVSYEPTRGCHCRLSPSPRGRAPSLLWLPPFVWVLRRRARTPR
jgi:photosystem II stability/assembly factor-like uncharacterized protein